MRECLNPICFHLGVLSYYRMRYLGSGGTRSKPLGGVSLYRHYKEHLWYQAKSVLLPVASFRHVSAPSMSLTSEGIDKFGVVLYDSSGLGNLWSSTILVLENPSLSVPWAWRTSQYQQNPALCVWVQKVSVAWFNLNCGAATHYHFHYLLICWLFSQYMKSFSL